MPQARKRSRAQPKSKASRARKPKAKPARARAKPVDPAKSPTLSIFTLKTRLVKLGSRAQTVAETPSLALYLRVYSPHEGPNAMHTRPYLDHAFTVLQGRARFHGLRGEVWEISRNEGILVPAGAYYCMENSGDDVLVILCSASLARHKGDPMLRLGVDGKHIDSKSPTNLRRSDYVESDENFG